MIGTEDRILNPWAHFAKKYGFIPLFGNGSTKYVLTYQAITLNFNLTTMQNCFVSGSVSVEFDLI